MRRVHLIYPHADRISCPDAIGRNLAEHLAANYEIQHYDWDDHSTIRPGQGDILLGHPHPSPRTIFRRSMKQEGWGRKLILAPYNHGDLRQSAWLEPVVRKCDLYLALTGEHWFETMPASSFQHWAPKMVQMDLAVDRRDFPPIKQDFNPSGRRRFLFIGHSTWTKNVGFLAELATHAPPDSISWMGSGPRILGPIPLGLQDFRDAHAKGLVADHDFLLSVGRADANPAAVLEAMAWGLIPVCSRESAHADLPGIVTLPIDNVPAAARVLADLQEKKESDLIAMRTSNWSALDTRFTWERFAARVVDAIESDLSPPIGRPGRDDRVRIARAKLFSPYAWWRPARIARSTTRRLRRSSG